MPCSVHSPEHLAIVLVNCEPADLRAELTAVLGPLLPLLGNVLAEERQQPTLRAQRRTDGVVVAAEDHGLEAFDWVVFRNPLVHCNHVVVARVTPRAVDLVVAH